MYGGLTACIDAGAIVPGSEDIAIVRERIAQYKTCTHPKTGEPCWTLDEDSTEALVKDWASTLAMVRIGRL